MGHGARTRAERRAAPSGGARLLTGALAGLVATFAMTAAMRRLHRHLPDAERYPLPPRELIDRLVPPARRPERRAEEVTMTAHFAYGAAAGAVMAGLSRRPSTGAGALFGVAVWAGSYLGWIPAVAALRPATQHPMRRNALMIAVHLVWGAAQAIAQRELVDAERESFAAGPPADAPGAEPERPTPGP